MDADQIQALKERLLKIAVKESWLDSDEFDPCGNSGGNYDDAFYGGESAGEIGLARELIEEFFPDELVEIEKE